MLLGTLSRRISCFPYRLPGQVNKSFLKHKKRTMATSRILECDDRGLEESAVILQSGGLVAFPTETVYGLGANALNESSVQSIFLAKKRPPTDPLIVHVLSRDNIYDLFDFDGLVCDTMGKPKAQVVCELLCDLFWPGPLTIIFKAKPVVPGAVTSGTGFVGLRSPRHAIARKLLQAAKLPVAAPSANRFGHVSPTSPVRNHEPLK
jgi:tRNA threonylcarbamoyl adenosine modification protein (Sua5/YciO/YrdC/YwlC family)